MDRVIWILSWTLVAIGTVFYFAWGFAFNVWTDVGEYSLAVTLIGFGLLGALLAKYKDENQ